MTPEDKLAALFAGDRPPARDFVFETEVARRVAARRAVATVLALVPPGLALGAGLWSVGPLWEILMITQTASLSQVLAPTGVAGLAAATLIWAAGRFSRG